jgi:hypothetical protein
MLKHLFIFSVPKILNYFHPENDFPKLINPTTKTITTIINDTTTPMIIPVNIYF